MIDKRITDFIKRHHTLNLATVSSEGTPYCAACFYAYDKERNRLIFTSDDTTRHAQEMAVNPNVACAITLETRVVGKVQGLQICGMALRGDEEDKRYTPIYPDDYIYFGQRITYAVTEKEASAKSTFC